MPHRELSPARLAATVRLAVARRPWIRWLVVVASAVTAAVAVHGQLAQVDAARDRWVDLVDVPVATRPHSPGETLSVAWHRFSAVAVPDDVMTEIPAGARVRHPVGRGEIVSATDVAAGDGPAALADEGDVVVPVSDPLAGTPTVGLYVSIFGEGLVLSASGRIVQVDADVVFVAVDADDAPMIAAAARAGTASIAFIDGP